MPERRLALLVGNGEYSDESLSVLKAPTGDVEALGRVLNDRKIGSFETTVIVDRNASDISVAISKLCRDVSVQDTVLIYYSGHGLKDESGKLHLAGRNTLNEFPRATAVPAQLIASELDRSSSKRQIIILDCCYAGAFDRGRKSASLEKVNAGLAFEGQTEGRGRYLLSATDETQSAYGGQEENSVFTHYMIEGLKTGDADIDDDGWISLDDLHTYISGKLRQQKLSQTPYKWAYKADGKVFIARNVRSKGFDTRTLPYLSDDVQSSIVSRHVDIRLGVVAALSKMINDGDASIAGNSRLALAHLTLDSNESVSHSAVSAMENEAEIYAVPSVRARGRRSDPSLLEIKIISIGRGIDIELIRVKEGKFLMGARAEHSNGYMDQCPQHAVHLEDYWIAKTPVTIRQFAEFVGVSNYVPASEKPDSVRRAYNRRNRRYEKTGNSWRNPFGRSANPPLTRDHPVVLVNWYDAIAFCKWASSITGLMIDLPTEAEWEKAARGLDGRRWPWGNELPSSTLCNYKEINRQTTPVGTYSPDGDSIFGCIDMAGNVWDWTNSAMRPYPFADVYDGSSRSEEGIRVLRGGSWRVKAYRLQCAFRKGWPIGVCVDGHGFRIVGRSI